MSDLSGRRARVTGSEADPLRDSTTVRAEVPEVELLTYPGVLRSVTHGTGAFSRRPSATSRRRRISRCPRDRRARASMTGSFRSSPRACEC
ncbi:hypothetical protein [Blastococcus brunescens]|uniref:Elongation factor EFG domain-containing protein n=1 Tax=Blastococcus brunescens TaxID=1564165 RepID=A0ABZ1B8D1_9ACTN|nr:hypothetical protein [Blastococcus sp. BMG 8361]WRL66381.1 hypothetical protein U6N30_13650 [Blastococcus sp. BMG 8361]